MATVLQDVKSLANALVLRLCSRMAEPDRLSEIVFGTAVAFTFLGAGICAMEQLEKLRPTVIPEYDICFELRLPAPERTSTMTANRTHSVVTNRPPRVLTEPQQVSRTMGINQSTTRQLAQPASAMVVRTARPDLPDAAQAAPLLPIQAGPDAANASITEPAEPQGAGSGKAPADPAPSVIPTGDLKAVAGADFGAQKTLAMATPGSKLYNIKPYKQDLLSRLAKNWRPHKGYDHIMLALSIAKDGSLTNCELIDSSGSETVDHAALEAVANTQFAPLPEWYKGEHLKCKLDLATVFKGEERIPRDP